VTHTLFLGETVTAFQSSDDGELLLGDAIIERKGGYAASASGVLSSFGAEGEVVVCLPPRASLCQSFRVETELGRRVTHTDLSDGLAAALRQAGGESHAVICAEPSEVLIDGQHVEGSAVGREAGRFEMVVTAFISPLKTLARLEKVCAASGLRLTGVMALEEAAAAGFAIKGEPRPPLLLIDRWSSVAMVFSGEGTARSATIPVGSGHLASDLAVTFGLEPEDAAATAQTLLLDRQSGDKDEEWHVLSARLDEIATKLAEALGTAQPDGPVPAAGKDGAVLLVGLPTSPRVVRSFLDQGIKVRAPRGEIAKTDPWPLAFAEAAVKLAQGAVPRTAATALQLSAPEEKSGPLDWLLRNF
jgi:hypothetical protein